MPYSTKAYYCHEEVRNKRLFDKRSFRSKIVGEHVIILGCPKGKYDKRTGICRVKPLLQKILHPQGEDKCPVSGVHFKSNPGYRFEGEDKLRNDIDKWVKAGYTKKQILDHLEEELQSYYDPSQIEQMIRKSKGKIKSNPIYKYQDYLDFVLSHRFNIEAIAVGFILYMKYTRKLGDGIPSKLATEFFGFLKELEKRDRLSTSISLTKDRSIKFITQGIEILQGKIGKIHPTTWRIIQYFVKGII